jgi:hypothetical protein
LIRTVDVVFRGAHADSRELSEQRLLARCIDHENFHFATPLGPGDRRSRLVPKHRTFLDRRQLVTHAGVDRRSIQRL